MSFTSKVERFDSDLWHFHITVPMDIAEQYIEGKNRRVVCTLNGQVSFQCSLMPAASDHCFININKKNRDKLGLLVGDVVEVSLQKDESKYGLPMPDEFKEMLNQDPEGDRLFHALTPGKQRNLLYIAGGVKSIEKRIERAIVIVDHLKIHEGKIDFKALNQEMKDFRANRR